MILREKKEVYHQQTADGETKSVNLCQAELEKCRLQTIDKPKSSKLSEVSATPRENKHTWAGCQMVTNFRVFGGVRFRAKNTSKNSPHQAVVLLSGLLPRLELSDLLLHQDLRASAPRPTQRIPVLRAAREETMHQ